MNILDELLYDKDKVIELINIDNSIMGTNYDFNYYYNLFKLSSNSLTNIDSDTLFITEGFPLYTLEILNSCIYSKYKCSIFINRGFIGMNKWLFSKFSEYYDTSNIVLDIDYNYNKYIGSKLKVIPIGEDAIINQVLEDFYGK